jgi:hypothetical protein
MGAGANGTPCFTLDPAYISCYSLRVANYDDKGGRKTFKTKVTDMLG